MKPNVGSDLLNQQIPLCDGRRLGFAQLGDPTGRPLIYCHGWPSSRLESCALSDACASMGVRVIAPDRPGCGLSDFKNRRTIPDWAGDVCELADHLRLEAFTVLGVSGGGPYAAVCAQRFPQRVLTAALVCSMAPLGVAGITRGMALPHRWLLHFAQHFPGPARIIAAPCLGAIWGKGERAIPRRVEERLPEPDRQTLASSRLRTILASSSQEGFRSGPRGPAWDGLLYARCWGFRLQDIRIPIYVWHGERDTIVPPAMGHYLADAIPQCRARFLPDDGHFSLPFNHLGQILAAMQPSI